MYPKSSKFWGEDGPWGVCGFMPKKPSVIDQPFDGKPKKILMILAPILLTTSFFCYLICYQFCGLVFKVLWCKSNPVSNTTKNHYNFVVAQPLLLLKTLHRILYINIYTLLLHYLNSIQALRLHMIWNLNDIMNLNTIDFLYIIW